MSYTSSLTLFSFCLVAEILIISDMLMGLSVKRNEYQLAFHFKVEPLYRPIRYLMKHSGLYELRADFSPFVTLIILYYIQRVLLGMY